MLSVPELEANDAGREKSKLTYHHQAQNHCRSTTICIEVISKHVIAFYLFGQCLHRPQESVP
jgi:hypothetical protein